jgi:hypothetical protein
MSERATASQPEDYMLLSPLSLQEAELKLKEEELSFTLASNLGVSRFDVTRVASNLPVEDEWMHGVIAVSSGGTPAMERKIPVWGVFDGHACVSIPRQ